MSSQERIKRRLAILARLDDRQRNRMLGGLAALESDAFEQLLEALGLSGSGKSVAAPTRRSNAACVTIGGVGREVPQESDEGKDEPAAPLTALQQS